MSKTLNFNRYLIILLLIVCAQTARGQAAPYLRYHVRQDDSLVVILHSFGLPAYGNEHLLKKMIELNTPKSCSKSLQHIVPGQTILLPITTLPRSNYFEIKDGVALHSVPRSIANINKEPGAASLKSKSVNSFTSKKELNQSEDPYPEPDSSLIQSEKNLEPDTDLLDTLLGSVNTQ